MKLLISGKFCLYYFLLCVLNHQGKPVSKFLLFDRTLLRDRLSITNNSELFTSLYYADRGEV